MRGKFSIWGCLLFVFILTPAWAQETPDWSVAGRLAGCWEGTGGGMEYTEQWMKPSGEIMLGMSRTVRPGKPTLFEFIRIGVVNGKLAYIAMPSKQAEATFRLARSSADELVFEDPGHDFPQRILYRFLPGNALLARIEGKVDGVDRAVDFPMKRASCP